jgi:hypothetical protein
MNDLGLYLECLTFGLWFGSQEIILIIILIPLLQFNFSMTTHSPQIKKKHRMFDVESY